MADAAAFFATKKKKKKAFKFNANLVAPSSVTSTVHVDAPALSTDQDVSALPVVDEQTTEWDDEAMANKVGSTTASSAAASAVNTAELGTLSLNPARHSETDDIAEKLRVEETKKQLAAARVGMEKTMAKEKEEKALLAAKKAQTKAANSAPRFGQAASTMASGTWLPPQKRGGGSSGIGLRGRMPGAKLDVADQELFPDLAAADKIIEQKSSQTPAFRAPKKTAVGGGATWASPKKVKPISPKEAAPKAESEPTTKTAAVSEENPKEQAPLTSAAPVKKAVTKKKKKKDVSAFKPSA